MSKEYEEACVDGFRSLVKFLNDKHPKVWDEWYRQELKESFA